MTQIQPLDQLTKEGLIELIQHERQQHQDALDAIGAGGVNGRLMPDISQQEQEAWQAGVHAGMEMTRPELDKLRAALSVCISVIRIDRESLRAARADARTGQVDDALGMGGLAEYDSALSMANAALAQQETGA